MFLEENEKVLKDVSGLHYKYALLFKKLFEENNISNCLELGFANGKSSCYIASILKDNGGGHLTTIDLRRAEKLTPNIHDLSKKLDLEEYITPYFERQSYTWRLMKLIESNSEPIFDFCFIDGGHNWYQDGFAFFLADKLLKPGALLIFEALNWKYSSSPSLKNSKFVKDMDEDERDIPHVKKIFDLLVKTHPNYERFEVIDDRLAIAYKKSTSSSISNLEKNFPSDSSNNQYMQMYHYTKLNNEIEELSSKMDTYMKKFNQFEKETNLCIDSNNILFNTLFLDYKLNPNILLSTIQNLCSELLSFVNNVCKKYGLEWWLDYGNLLGAVRHKNYVPWDDDVDIGMMRDDYHKFIDIIYTEIDNANLSDFVEIVYRYRKFNGKAINSFVQIFVKDILNDKKTIYAGVDIFPYDYLKGYDEKTFGNFYEKSKRNYYTRLTQGTDRKKVYMGLDYENVIGNYYSELNLSYEKSEYIIPGVEGSCGFNGTNLYELMIIKTDKVFPLIEREFGKFKFPCPNDADYYLKLIYGDYLKVPKKIRSHGRVNDFRKNFDNNTFFEVSLKRLRDVNASFNK